jgi:membrane-associated phospholipid phosphatase
MTILVFVFLAYVCGAYSQDLQNSDSINIQTSFSPKTQQKGIKSEKHSGNFYKADSVFSFRSSKGYFPSLAYDFGAQLVAPFKINHKQFINTSIATGITVGLYFLDGDIDEWARNQKQKHNWVNKSSPFITHFGGDWGIYSTIASGLLGAVCSKEKLVQTSLLATQAMITSGVWANIVKVLTGRERPMADYAFSKSESGTWYGPFAVWDQDLAIRKPVSAFDAFPSGHSATAFSIATVFAMQYKDIKAIPVICYSAATLVGVSRLTEHEHWASDVFVGSILGYLCGKQVVNHYNKTHYDQSGAILSVSKPKAELTFVQYDNQAGFRLRW